MALASDSETQKKISIVVCLSTPFIEAKERKSITWSMLHDLPLMSWLVTLAMALVVSWPYGEKLGLSWLATMIFVAVWIGLTGALSLYTHILGKNVQSADVLSLYKFGQIPAHILSLRTRFDEALTGLHAGSHLGTVFNLLPATSVFAAGLLLITPLLGIFVLVPFFMMMDVSVKQALGWMFPLGITLAILFPFIVLPSQFFWAIIRAAAMGENPQVGILFSFNVVARPVQLGYFEERVVTDFGEFPWFKFRFNHSYLHSRKETAIPIAEVVRSYRFDQERPSTLFKANNPTASGSDFDWIEWAGLGHLLGVPLTTVVLACGLASYIGVQTFGIFFGHALDLFVFFALVGLTIVILPVSRRPAPSLLRLSVLLAVPFSLVFIWFSWLNGSIGWTRTLNYFLASLVGVFSFLILLSSARAYMRPHDADSDYLDSTSEWIYRCSARLSLLHPTMGFLAAEEVAEKLSKQKEFRLQSPEMVADGFQASSSTGRSPD